jgi:hypothetical protein
MAQDAARGVIVVGAREAGTLSASLDNQCAEHTRLTAEIIAAEEDLNARVYSLFHLTPAEIALLEETTKYRYGEV